jgi:RNA polymerase sigma factor (sigma-70 family)
MTIGESIKLLRKEEGLSARALAELIGVTGSTICQYEKGGVIPPIKRLKQICKACNRSLILKIYPDGLHCKFMLRESVREVSFNEKITECWKPLYSYCIRYLCRNKDDAKDLVQDTLLAAIKAHNTLRSDVGIMTWLIGIAKNLAVKKKSKLSYVEKYIETDLLTNESEEFFRKNVNVWKYVNKINKNRRRIFELSAIGLSYRDIAEQTGSTENSIKNTMCKIRTEIKKLVNDER